MFRCNHHPQGAHYLSLLKLHLLKTNITLASLISALPEDGDYTETCWRYFNVNFNTPFKKNLNISWCKNFDNIKKHGTTLLGGGEL